MPLFPPGNKSFRAYIDEAGKYKSIYTGPEPIVCDYCRRETFLNLISGRCPWCRLPQRPWRYLCPFGVKPKP